MPVPPPYSLQLRDWFSVSTRTLCFSIFGTPIPDLVLIIRPSFVMRFEQLWRQDRPECWNLLLHVSAAPEIPTIGKLIGVSVLGELGAQLDDLEPLIAALESPDASSRP
jgi:hypothetical protein